MMFLQLDRLVPVPALPLHAIDGCAVKFQFIQVSADSQPFSTAWLTWNLLQGYVHMEFFSSILQPHSLALQGFSRALHLQVSESESTESILGSYSLSVQLWLTPPIYPQSLSSSIISGASSETVAAKLVVQVPGRAWFRAANWARRQAACAQAAAAFCTFHAMVELVKPPVNAKFHIFLSVYGLQPTLKTVSLQPLHILGLGLGLAASYTLNLALAQK